MSEETVSQEVLEEALEVELPPELVEEVESAKEAVKSFDDLWRNLMYQHREKYSEYSKLQEALSAMSFDREETRVDFTQMNNLRDEIVKLEGGLETLNLYRQFVMGVDPEPWVESEIQEKRKLVKVKTNSPYSKKGKDYSQFSNWESNQAETDATLNKTT